jgi:hypothetical protein
MLHVYTLKHSNMIFYKINLSTILNYIGQVHNCKNNIGRGDSSQIQVLQL